MTVERRYQVFVSSTYQDLEEERKEIIQALLELDCIPSGMELFPAASDDQWSLIKRVIDDCDYYLVVVAGRYGSVSEKGISYTEMEYRYALESGMPIIGFLHKDPAQIPVSKSETDPERIKKLNDFRNLVSKKMIKYWTTPAELGSVVSRSLIRLIKDHPSPGWIRGDNLSSDMAREEILRLKSRVEELESEINSVTIIDSDTLKSLSKGNDVVPVKGVVTLRSINYDLHYYNYTCNCKWDEIFAQIAPILMDEATKREIKLRINDYISQKEGSEFQNGASKKGEEYIDYSISDESLDMFIIQFTALNYIERGVKKRPISDKGNYFKLTSIGERKMYELRAVRKAELAVGADSGELQEIETSEE